MYSQVTCKMLAVAVGRKNEQQATSNKQQATSNEQQATSNKQPEFIISIFESNLITLHNRKLQIIQILK